MARMARMGHMVHMGACKIRETEEPCDTSLDVVVAAWLRARVVVIILEIAGSEAARKL